MSAAALETIVVELNRRLVGFDGEARENELQRIVLGYLHAAKTDKERLFWRSMLK